ncbi:methylmalonyl-CoA mutase subunit beta [Aquimarina pacifica]|uniref:methylmalonyl-CoA mutase subunit beta n=1 Tax=Aquimarina pacifica TaxID=1296415 RepID=UPI00046FDED8|nr:methylmalonyl-CoA mutase subunit beta [Aquimarina pacifica]
MTKSLFDSFEEVSAKQWKQKIQFDLKGEDYNETLIFKSLEGIDIKPFYHQEDLKKVNITVPKHTSWKNSLKIEINDGALGNKKIVEAIKKGAESLYLLIRNKEVAPSTLFQNIPEGFTIFIETTFISFSYIKTLLDTGQSTKLNIYIATDIIGNLAITGNWFTSLQDDFNELKKISHLSNSKSTITVNLGDYQNSGANIIQQLAYGIAHANEYLNYFDGTTNHPLKRNPILFKVSIGGNYFFEIAKIRALRTLWSTLATEYNVSPECHIIAHPSHRNKTILDYNVNMLRTTTECMSAILGGANTVYNLPYDDIYNQENEFGTRISINQLLILKNESYFDIVSNPASGSYYIESITEQLAEKALSLFKDIEKNGGFLNQLKAGKIQKKIKESALKEQELFDNQEIILTGSNKYKTTNEVIPSFEKVVFPEKKVRKTLLEPLIKRRLSEKIEKKIR